MRARRPSLLVLDRALIAIIAALLVGSGAAYGRSSSHSGSHSHSHRHTSSGTHSHHGAVGVPRDSPGHMQWQTTEAAKEKDGVE